MTPDCQRRTSRRLLVLGLCLKIALLLALTAEVHQQIGNLKSNHGLASALRGLPHLQVAEAAFDFDLNEPAPLDEDENENENEHSQRYQKSEEPEVTTAATTASSEPTTRGGRLWAKLRQKLPRYFDFREFTRKFKRSYSALEASVRRSIFFSACTEVFKSRVAYRLGKTSYLQEVNKYADLSRAEFDLMFMPAPPPEFQHGGGKAAHDTYVRKLRERKSELDREQEKKQLYMTEVDTQGCGDSAAAALCESDEARAKRELDEYFKAELDASHEHGDSELEEAMARALREEYNELGVETSTQGMGMGDGAPPLPWPGKLKSADTLRANGGDWHSALAAPYSPPPVERLEEAQGIAPALDWSQHECFHEIYDQGEECGKCYVLATTSLAEFYKCSEAPPGAIKLRKFSKLFVLDCAMKFAPTIMGCAGGSPYDTLRFIGRAGACSMAAWTRTRQTKLREMRELGELALSDEIDRKCPLNPTRTPFEEWGHIHVELNPKPVSANDWLDALQDGPLVASIQLPVEGMKSYAGGIHDGHGCERSNNWHAMLLVGYGLSERGEPYWRFRNSFGPDWGDAGHFNLAMDVPAACIAGGVRVYREPLDS